MASIPEAGFVAFVSYSHVDRRWAQWLHRSIETYRIPERLQAERGFGRTPGRVFIDRAELAASTDLAESVRQALGRSRAMVVICSPSAARSRWVAREIEVFRALGRGDRVYCLIVDGDARDAGGAADPFPAALRRADGSEPLAADARPGGDGRRDAKLKLIASLLDVEFDSLRQREVVRQQRRLVAIAAAAVVSALVFGVLAITASLAQREAERQRTVAVRTTDFLKSLFKVSDPSEARGRAITAREILDQGSRKIDAELASEPRVRADLTVTMAEVYASLGLYRDAVSLSEKAGAIGAEGEAAALRNMVLAGEIAISTSDYPKAASLFGRALRRDDLDPALRTRALLGRAETETDAGRFDSAERDWLAARRLSLDRDPPDPDAAAVALAGLAANAFYADKLDLAEARYAQAIDERVRRYGALHPAISDNYNAIGAIAYARGDRAGAQRAFERVVALDRRILGSTHPDVGTAMNNLARIYLERRNYAAAAAMLDEASRIILAQQDADWDIMAFVFGNRGLAYAGLGDAARAEAMFTKGIAVSKRHRHRMEGPIETDLAALECRSAREADGLERLDRAAALVAKAYPDDAWRSALIENVRAGCLAALGRGDEAAPLFARSEPVLLAKWGRDGLYGYDALARRAAAQR